MVDSLLLPMFPAPIGHQANRTHPDERAVLAAAADILERRARRDAVDLGSPSKAKEIAKLRFARLEHEVFAAFWLDACNRLIAYEPLFRGTATQTSVYPREVVKAALAHNAVAVIFAHNHPSGRAEPSAADQSLTRTLKNALALVDVQVLDHLVVGESEIVSFADRGLV